MTIESSPFLKTPLMAYSRSLKLSPSYLPAHLSPSRVPVTAKASSAIRLHSRAGAFSRSFSWFSLLTMRPTCLEAIISSSAAFSSSGGSSEDGLPGIARGGGVHGERSGRDGETRPIVGETEEDPAIGSDVIFLSVEGMTCGGCSARVKRILESQPQVASASVHLEKKVAVVWPVPEAKDVENWPKNLGEKLANHLTSCGFKSILQGQGQ